MTDGAFDPNDTPPAYDKEGRANLAPISKEECEAAWVKSFEFLAR